MKTHISIIVFCSFAIPTIAQEPNPFTERASELGNALGVPNSSPSTVWTTPLFSAENTIITNGLKIIKQDEGVNLPTSFLVLSNEVSVAHGKLFELSSFETASNALLVSLVVNSLSIEIISVSYKSLPNGVGDFRFIGKKFDYITGNETDNPSIIHFVRGAKAVSLHGKDGADVQPIAEVLDELLKHPPASQP